MAEQVSVDGEFVTVDVRQIDRDVIQVTGKFRSVDVIASDRIVEVAIAKWKELARETLTSPMFAQKQK